MPTIFVASSKIVQEWAGDVGLSKSIFKLGVSETSAEDAIATFNAERYAGGDDWKLVKKQKADDADRTQALKKRGHDVLRPDHSGIKERQARRH